MEKLKNINIGSYLFSFLFLLLMGIGFLCNKDTDLHGAGIAAVFGITFVGCIPFAYIVNKLYCKLDNRNCEKYSKISFKKIFLILMICYTIFFISIFPGMVHYDSQICILQYFGIKNPVSAQVVLLNPTQLITDHHRIAYVYLIGTCMKIGKMITGSYTPGYAAYILIQYTFFAFALSRMISYGSVAIKHKSLIVLFLLNPLLMEIPFLANKDSIFTAFGILFLVEFFEAYQGRLNLIRLLPIIIGMFLFRANAAYALIPALLVAGLILKQKKMIIPVVVLIVVMIGYNSILLPTLQISPASKKEMLSVPFQATARYIQKYEVTKKEKDTIDKVLDYDEIRERYFPVLSDPVKDTYKKDATGEDLKEYFKVWIEMGLKHPGTYMESVLYNIYGYFYPGFNIGTWAKKCGGYPIDESYILHGWINPRFVEDAGFKIPFNKIKVGLYVLVGYEWILEKIPVINVVLRSALYFWLMAFAICFCIHKKRWKNLSWFVFLLLYLGTVFLGPVSGNQRYMLLFVCAFCLYPYVVATQYTKNESGFSTEQFSP